MNLIGYTRWAMIMCMVLFGLVKVERMFLCCGQVACCIRLWFTEKRIMTGRLCLGLQTSAHYFIAEASSERFRETNTVHQRQPGIYSIPDRQRKKLVQGVYVGVGTLNHAEYDTALCVCVFMTTSSAVHIGN